MLNKVPGISSRVDSRGHGVGISLAELQINYHLHLERQGCFPRAFSLCI